MVTYFQPKHWWKSMGFLQRNTTDVHLHIGICGIRPEEHVHIWWEGYRVVARGCFTSRQLCLIHCTGHNHVTGELHRNNVWAPKVGSGGCTKPTVLGYGKLGYCYRDVSNDTYIFLDITYLHYNTLFQVKVSLVLLQRDPDLILTHTKRPNLTNYVACMTYCHWVRIPSNQ